MISIIQQNGLIYKILMSLGIDVSTQDPNSAIYITCVIISSVIILAIISLILKGVFSMLRGGRL